jgi:RNA polymerase sigma-70 factor (ECF subfamily)
MNMEAPDARGESDARLVADAREGSDKAFREIVERHHPMVCAVVRGVLGDHPDVEDVIQDVFIKVYRGLSGFRGDAKLSSWIYPIARNEALSAVRKVAPPSESIDEVVVESPGESSPDEQYQRKALRERLERCLSEIDENYRTVLELRYTGEMSYGEISDATGLPVGTVKTYIHRAKIELKRLMSRKQFVETYGRREQP